MEASNLIQGGRAQRWAGASVLSLLSTMIASATSLAVAAFLMVILLATGRFVHIYAARPLHFGPGRLGLDPTLPSRWISRMWRATEVQIWHDCGFEAMMFLRYLRLLVILFAITSCLLPPLLIPISWRHGRGLAEGVTGLDRLGWPNVHVNAHGRHWAFCGAVWILLACFVTAVTLEVRRTAWLRQHYLRTRAAAGSHLVLVEHVPEHYRDEAKLQKLYESRFLATFKRVFVIQDDEEWGRLWTEYHRLNELRQCPPLRNKMHTGSQNSQVHAMPVCTSDTRHRFDDERLADLRSKISDRERVLAARQAPRDAVILSFTDSTSAQQAAQMIHHPCAGRMTPQFLGTTLATLCLDNVGLSWSHQLGRRLSSYGLAVSFLVLWSIPIAMTGLLSQLESLAALCGWTQALQGVPDLVVGFIQGAAPSLVLSILMAVVPLVIDLLVRLQRLPTMVNRELAVQQWYFWFMLVHVFLVPSVAASLTTILTQVAERTSQIPLVLALNLPRASNYFVSYVLIQALVGGALVCLQPLAWTRHLRGQRGFVKSDCGGARPPSHVTESGQLRWGLIYPVFTVLACTVLIFAPLAPIILPVATIAFGLIRWVYCYLVLFTACTGVETGGQLYLRGVTQLFWALYIVSLYFAGLFTLIFVNTLSIHSAVQVVAMLMTLLITAVFHFRIAVVYSPLFSHVAICEGMEETDGPFGFGHHIMRDTAVMVEGASSDDGG